MHRTLCECCREWVVYGEKTCGDKMHEIHEIKMHEIHIT